MHNSLALRLTVFSLALLYGCPQNTNPRDHGQDRSDRGPKPSGRVLQEVKPQSNPPIALVVERVSMDEAATTPNHATLTTPWPHQTPTGNPDVTRTDVWTTTEGTRCWTSIRRFKSGGNDEVYFSCENKPKNFRLHVIVDCHLHDSEDRSLLVFLTSEAPAADFRVYCQYGRRSTNGSR